MEKIADNIYLLDGFPRYAVNIYLIDNVLIDAGYRVDRKRILHQLRGHKLSAHTLTHVHPDHQGSSHAICETHNLPLWCPANDARAAESGDMSSQFPKGYNPIVQIQNRFLAGPGHRVDRALHEGDDVASFTVIDVPGHTPGHVAYWREHDRVLILGDVAFNMNPMTMRVGLVEPPTMFTPNPTQNRASLRKLAALHPRIVCFGHGPPMRDGAHFQEFVAQLTHDVAV